MGAAITYLRRYSLSAIVGVVCDDDDDGETAVGRGKTKGASQPSNHNQGQNKQEIPEVAEKLNKAEIVALTTLIQSLDEESNKSFFDWINKSFKATSVQDIPKAYFEKCIFSINAKIKYLKDQEKSSMAVA
jgi:hypothetical protein